ncbi:thiol-disulfide oxidoreductase DCC family protein [Ruegeria sp. 6PALISEP08]|uniref:thiol-disulfide oxidoreductase DCC family protein n=1 Tax=Ruegeria sp. 6PALISEP08 TaxID=1225660 RepID=UPI00067E6E32|nr:DCC1-like thiol-disulfide oxidoreductase family protein [Ruegeria sp. 6PALISEP08]
MLDHAEITEAYGRNLIVFDGECVLCSGFFNFMLRHDRSHRFQFATAQSPLGQKLYQVLELPTQDFQTNLVIVDGVIYQHLDAFAAAMRQLQGLWRVLSLCRFLPKAIKDPAYRLIARNRYRLFGRSGTCLVPGPDIVARFARDGF